MTWNGGAEWRPQGSVALIGAAAIWLIGTGWLGYEYAHHKQLVAEQGAVIQRAYSTNADLQEALGRMRDHSQKSIQQLTADNLALVTRITALELRLSLERPAGRDPVASHPPALPGAGFGGVAAARKLVAPPAITTVPDAGANFTAPRWAPDYFTDEAGPLTGSSRREQRAYPRGSEKRQGSLGATSAIHLCSQCKTVA
jgi:hypothetical protein